MKAATPARQPQKEYIITEEDILILEDTFGVTMIMPRSRPHTSPQAPARSTCYQTCPVCKQQVVTHCNIPAQMAQEAAKAAREQVLKEIRFDIVNNTLPKQSDLIKLKQEILSRIESLRAQPQGGVSE